MEIMIPYGSGKMSVKVSEKNLMLLARPAGQILPAGDEREEIRRSLEQPIGSSPLRSLAAKLHSRDKVVILVSDYTRPTPSSRILPPLLEEMGGGGISPAPLPFLRFPPGGLC